MWWRNWQPINLVDTVARFGQFVFSLPFESYCVVYFEHYKGNTFAEEGKIVGFDPAYDLAVLKVDVEGDKLRPALIGASHDLRVGQSCFAIGNPYGWVDTADREDFLKLKDMEVPSQKDLLTDHALYNVELGLAPVVVSIGLVDIPSVAVGLTDIPPVVVSAGETVVALPVPTTLPTIEVPSVEAPSAVEELDDDVIIVEVPTDRADPMLSRAPSMLEVGSVEQRPTVSQMPLMLEWMSASIDRPSGQRHGKASVISTGSEASSGSTKFLDTRILVGELALTNSALAKRLVEAALLSTDRESRSRIVVEMFSSFYPTILSLAHDMLVLEKEY
ncbi:hypothetical protein COCNU_scaffold003185G000020 [Cocos nucifera]|nr:hypothetical protein [Cocos nucifera]